MFKTAICDLLGIKYPIFQGGMAWVATGELAAAVSSSGGLGIIGAGNAPPEIVKKEIDKVRESTSKPFGVNVYYMSPYTEEIIDLIIEEKVPVVTTGAGNPGKHIKKFKEAQVKVFPVVASVALAKRLEKTGVDGVIAEGMECGGHIGEIATMPLVPQVVDAVKIPVIAAGGIATGRGFAAALSLGAEGVQIGTRFVCSEECTVHENYKNALLKAKDRDAVATGFSGHYVRVLKNKLSDKLKELENKGADSEEFEKLGVGRLQAAALDGDVKNGSVMAGQSAAMVCEIMPVEDIINGIVNEAAQTVNRLSALV